MENQISDASDFTHSRIPKLSQLDTLLRCHICKDFLKVPVLTPCGHTFCSLCIREYISVQAKCPLCLTELRESMLRSEFLVSEIVESYKVVRDDLLDILKKRKESPESDPDSSIIEVGSDPEDSLIVNDNQSDDTSDDIKILQSGKPISLKRIYTDITSSSLRTAPRSKYFKTNIPMKRSSTASRIDSILKKPVELVPCPICEKYFPVKELERTHLDECLTLQSLDNKLTPLTKTAEKDEVVSKGSTVIPPNKSLLSRSLWRMKPREEEGEKEEKVSFVDKYINSTTDIEHQRLPKLDFPSMTITQIKQKLSNLGLSTTGTKQNMMARYNYYEILWNSNFCDSLNPVNVSELKRQLLNWEASRKVHNGTNLSTSIGNLMTLRGTHKQNDYKKLLDNFKTDKFNRKEWCILFRKQFRRLIKDAKKGQTSRTLNADHIQEFDIEEQLTDPDLSNDLFDKLDKTPQNPQNP